MGVRLSRTRRGALLAPLVAFILVGAAGATVSGASRHLIDGSVSPSVPQVLRAQDRTFVMSRVRVVAAKELRRLVSACGGGEQASPKTLVVERIGVNGRTITFRTPGSGIAGCDRNPKARAIQKPWCGGSAWVLRRGQVSDARLDICYAKNQRPVVAFGWINALPAAKWIVVVQPGFKEVYPVAAHLPVRVSTVVGIGSPTSFRTAQYDARGVLLGRKVVRASVAS